MRVPIDRSRASCKALSSVSDKKTADFMQLDMIFIPVVQLVRNQLGRAAALGSGDDHGFLFVSYMVGLAA